MDLAQPPSSRTIEVNGIPVPLVIIRSARRKKTLSFSLGQPLKIRVHAPLKTPLSIIDEALKNRLPWISKRLKGIHNKQAQCTLYKDGSLIYYLGFPFTLQITFHTTRPRECLLRPHNININLHLIEPDTADLVSEIRLNIALWLKKRARIKLAKRIHYWSCKTSIPFRKVRLSNATHRWGSCSADNTIRLSWRLIMAHQSLMDYVIVHELCHVKHKNHGPKFWDLVASIMPDYKYRQERLKSLQFSI